MSFPAQPPHQSALNHTVTITHQPLIIRGRIQVSEGSLDLLQVAAEYLTGLISCLPYNHPIFLNNYELLEANKKNKKKKCSHFFLSLHRLFSSYPEQNPLVLEDLTQASSHSGSFSIKTKTDLDASSQAPKASSTHNVLKLSAFSEYISHQLY